MAIIAQTAPLVSWEPALDTYRTSTGWVLKIELAGVEPADIEIDVKGSTVVIRGVRRDCIIEKGWRQYSMEIVYSRFERVITLPQELEPAQISRECRQGMFLVRLTCARGDL